MFDAAQVVGLASGVSSGLRFLGRTMASLIVGMAFTLSLQALVAGAGQTINASAAEVGEAGFATITSAELASMLKDKDFFFVNVHVPYEGEIEGTDVFIAFDEIAADLGRLPADRSASIVLYCRSGRMSETAAAELSRLGYANVAHLGGGMVDWKASGHEVIEK